MKKNKRNIRILIPLIICIGGMLITSCESDLDISPEDPNSFLADDFYTTPESYKQGLAGVYANLALTSATGPNNSNISGLDAGTSQYGRGLWNLQELTTDEVKWSWENDPGTRDLNRNSWSADNAIIRGFFGRCMAQVAFANEYLRQTTNEKLASRDVTDSNLLNDIAVYRAEARFLRAFAYYHIMDMFGKAGFITENDPVGFVQSPEYNRQQLFQFIESETLDILPTLLDPLQNEYARIDKAAAWMLLAKIYLNAEVYIGEDKYTDCITYCNNILQTSYTLSPIYANNFNADNDTNSARNEIIFPVVSDGITTQNWGPTTLMVNGQVGSLEQNGQDFGVGAGGWGGALRVTREFSEIFMNGTYSTDDRNTLITADRPIDITDIGNNGTGYIIGKWSNKTSSGNNGSANEQVDTDFPMFRLADVYLIYVEATLRGGNGGTLGQSATYINALRIRANNNNTITTNDLTLDIVLQERLVELHWEGHRRQDLIRFNRYTGGSYNWNWKGNSLSGISISDHLKVFPIPNASLASNSNLTQNNGY
ncbi:MAG: RagB/SusD family nutrient uptake outer membrane protein [Bacteroidota bacterium]